MAQLQTQLSTNETLRLCGYSNHLVLFESFSYDCITV